MERCKTCKRWERCSFAEWGHKCEHCPDDDESNWTYELIGGTGNYDYDVLVFMPGPEFGCVHHQAKGKGNEQNITDVKRMSRKVNMKRTLFILNGDLAVDIDNNWWNRFFSYTEQEFCSCCKVNLLDKYAWERESEGRKTEILCTGCIKVITLGVLINVYERKGKDEEPKRSASNDTISQ